MFDLNQAIAHWRRTLSDQPGVRPADLEELEDHLRESMADLQAGGLSEEEAFLVASRRMGDPADLGSEFAIADPDNRRRFRLRWMVVGGLAAFLLWQASGFMVGMGAFPLMHFMGAGPNAMAGNVALVGLTRLLVLVLGVVLIWKLLASDGGSRRIGSLGPGGIVVAILALAFLMLVTRIMPGFTMARGFAHGPGMTWAVANGYANIILGLLLPCLLLVGLWRLLRR